MEICYFIEERKTRPKIQVNFLVDGCIILDLISQELVHVTPSLRKFHALNVSTEMEKKNKGKEKQYGLNEI